jgi:L-gulonate 5-dehydrogenase
MKAAILRGDRDIRVGEVPEPHPAAGELLVEVGFTGICGTDLHIYRGEFKDRVQYPAILGHEFGGKVVEVGPGVQGFTPGDQVAIDPILSCHACTACLGGRINACRTLKLLGIDVAGGFGQYVVAPANHAFPVPDSVPSRHLSMVEMYALGIHVLSRGQVQGGESVVLLGAGKLGLSVLDVLCHGASPVLTIVADRQSLRLETARRLGADHVIDITREDPVARVLEITQGAGADCVIEAVGHFHLHGSQEPPLGQAVRMIRNGGRIVTAGLGEQLTAVHFKSLVLKEAEIIATRVTLGEFPRAIRMMAAGRLHTDWLITDTLPLRDARAAFAKVDEEDPRTIKVVLDLHQA